MPTPTFKLLLNALRLGQPQDPQAAIFALVEAIAAQDETIDDLKRRLQVVQSAANILETKASRLEMELEILRSTRGDREPTHDRNRSEPPPRPHAAAPNPARQASQRPPPPPAPAHGPPPVPTHPSPNATRRAPSALPPPNNVRAASEHPPAIKRTPTPQPESLRLPRAAPVPEIPEHPPSDEDSMDDIKVETVVVSRKDVQALMNPEAPFRLAPAGQRIAERGSIPGAPWARGRTPTLTPQPGAVAHPSQPPLPPVAPVAPVHGPPPGGMGPSVLGPAGMGPSAFTTPAIDEVAASQRFTEDFTLDAIHDMRDEEEEGVTYDDVSARTALASALGLAPNDPRLDKLRALGADPRAAAAAVASSATREDDTDPGPRRR